jgi:hypothetical protein
MGAAVIPAGSGLDMLRAIDGYIRANAMKPIVVIDNVHRLPSVDVCTVLDICRSLRFVLLAQPWAFQPELEALIGVQAELLSGWDTNTIAAEFSARGCRIDLATAERWRVDTAGMPMYIRNAAQLTATYYQGDAARMANEVAAQVHATATAQDIILGRVIEGLREETRTAIALLSLANTPLARSEANELLATSLPNGAAIGRSLRELTGCGAAQAFQDGRIKVHDAMRPIGRASQGNLAPGILLQGQTVLRDLLLRSFEGNRDLSRFGLWLRLLAPTGQIETLVEVATQEHFHEAGDPSDLKAILESAAEASDQTDEARFWTLDALAFWDWQHEGHARGQFPTRVARMAQLIANGGLGNRERAALGMKQMLAASITGDAVRVDEAFRETASECRESPMLMRLLRYNRATALFHLRYYQGAEDQAELLAQEYYDVLKLDPREVVAANPPEIIAAIGGLEEHQDDLKHLADCLDLYAMARAKRGLPSGLARLHAMKFYVMSGASRSAVKAGQEAVDDFIAIYDDAEGARQLMENHLLPLIRASGLVANEIAVRAQYAVVLSYCGEVQAAQTEMQRLKAYASALPLAERDELENQVELVDAINRGLVTKPERQRASPLPPRAINFGRVGRNQPCPCGSGLKFKRCHGA